MSAFTLPTLNLAPLAAFGSDTAPAASSTAAPSDSSSSGIDTIIGALKTIVWGPIGNKMANATNPDGTSAPWDIGRIVAIVLGFVIIAGGVIALTVSKETVINVARTAVAA